MILLVTEETTAHVLIGLAAIVAGGVTQALVGRYSAGKMAGATEQRFVGHEKRLDHIEVEQRDQWSAIGTLRDGQGEIREKVGKIEGQLQAKGRGATT